MNEELLKMMNVVPGGRRHIVRMGDRYIVYLPVNLNSIWEYIHEQGRKVEVYIILKKGGEKDE